jgi:hypothetical protein
MNFNKVSVYFNYQAHNVKLVDASSAAMVPAPQIAQLDDPTAA